MAIIDLNLYRNIVVLTGAGVSVASGLPTYRGEGGLWTKFDEKEIGHIDYLMSHPDEIWPFFLPLRKAAQKAERQ